MGISVSFVKIRNYVLVQVYAYISVLWGGIAWSLSMHGFLTLATDSQILSRNLTLLL